MLPVGATVLALAAFSQAAPPGAPPETSSPSEPAPSPPAAERNLGPPSAPPLSWDLLGGGVPDAGVLASARVGFSRLGEIRLEVPILDALLVGAWMGFDLGYWRLDDAGSDPGLVFGASARYRILHDAEWSIGVSARPGGRARFGGGGGGELIVPLEARALYAVDPRILLGFALDVPIRLGFPGDDPDTTNDEGRVLFALPITLGFAGEAHLLPSLAVTAVLGLGPDLNTDGVGIAFRAMVGVGYRL